MCIYIYISTKQKNHYHWLYRIICLLFPPLFSKYKKKIQKKSSPFARWDNFISISATVLKKEKNHEFEEHEYRLKFCHGLPKTKNDHEFGEHEKEIEDREHNIDDFWGTRKGEREKGKERENLGQNETTQNIWHCVHNRL